MNMISRSDARRHLASAGLTTSGGPGIAGLVGGTVAALGIAALANHLVARRTERRHPPRGKFVTVDGVRLHYLDQGSGPPVVLLHGNGTMAEDYAISGVLDRVARDHRVIAFDRPGFGHSPRPRGTVWTAAAQAALLWKALRQIGIQRPVVVGHSWGTLVALNMALEAPDDTAALVMLSGYYFPTIRKDVVLGAGPAIPLLGDIQRYTIAPLLGWILSGAVYRKLFGPAPVTPAFAARFSTGMALRPSQLRATAADTALMIPAAVASFRRHGELRMPVFIVTGAGDRIASAKGQSGRLHADIAGSDLHVVDGAGHMIHHLAPDAVVEAIAKAARPPVTARLAAE